MKKSVAVQLQAWPVPATATVKAVMAVCCNPLTLSQQDHNAESGVDDDEDEIDEEDIVYNIEE